MKLSFLPALVAAVSLVISAPDACAKKKPKHKPGADSAALLPDAKPDYSEPAQALAPYITNLEQLLAIRRSGTKPVLEFLDRASGQLTVAWVEFAAQRKSADPEDQPAFDAAIATCDALKKSLEEREKVRGNIITSQAMKGSGKLEAGPRRDSLTQGINGSSPAIELKREKAAAAAAQARAARTDEMMTANSINLWNKRALDLRKYITDTYARIQ